MVADTIEISVKGKWLRVPALNIHGKSIVVKGAWPRVAMVHDEWWIESEVKDPETYMRQLKAEGSSGLRADIFTFTQKTPGSAPKYGYAVELDSVAAARTSSFKEWWDDLPQESRKNVRRSQKRGVVIKTEAFGDDLVRGIAGVNNDSPMRQGVPNTHFGKSFDRVKKDHESFLDRSDFICAYLEGEMIGYLKLVYRGDVAAILNLSVKASHSDKRPANALIATAVEHCEKNHVSYLTYGYFNYGNKRDSPLREFKSRNGFEEALTPRFYVPLTAGGRVAMKMGLHRGLLGIVPSNAITLGLALRAKWYNLKEFTRRCSSTLERPNRTRQMERSIPPAGSKP